VKTYAEPAHCPQLLPCIAATMVPTQLDDELELSDPELPRPDDVTSTEAACDAAFAAAISSGKHGPPKLPVTGRERFPGREACSGKRPITGCSPSFSCYIVAEG
jgi:hypothetical protein